MNLTDMTIEEMCTTTEKQSFDRKSAKIEATAIATPMIAFANADGGILAVGIEDNGDITGIDDYAKNINEILRAGYDFCQPSIFIEKETVECIDKNGNANHILLIKIPQSADMHVNHRDEAFLRVGDRSKKLTFDERMELMYSKGMRFYEDEPVYRSTLDDIDMEFVAKYCEKIGYGKTPEEYIRQNKDYIVNVAGRQEMSGAAIMMFGKDTQRFFPRSRVRFIRYEGTEAKVGAEMNVIKDKMFQGRILDLVEQEQVNSLITANAIQNDQISDENIEDVENLKIIDSSPLITNQTTLSINQIENISNKEIIKLASIIKSFVINYKGPKLLKNYYFDALEDAIANNIIASDNKDELLLELGIKEFYIDKEEAVQTRSVLVWEYTKSNIGKWKLKLFVKVMKTLI